MIHITCITLNVMRMTPNLAILEAIGRLLNRNQAVAVLVDRLTTDFGLSILANSNHVLGDIINGKTLDL